ncbi:hypothetical protein F4777DRAFT_270159 [Nemania sp. FL0916]|nr:hypothetical protein F4777DRAFT_270159 [Nemania sp. FL0916]
MECSPPHIDWLRERQWHWKYSKFGMQPDELFTTLHKRCNTWTAQLQSWEAFHHDVWEMSDAAKTKEEFLQNLDQRSQQRLDEMINAWDAFMPALFTDQGRLEDEQWKAAVQFVRSKSFDTLLGFFFSFVSPSDRQQVIEDYEEENQLVNEIRRRRAKKAQQDGTIPSARGAPSSRNSGRGDVNRSPNNNKDKVPVASPTAAVSNPVAPGKDRATSPVRGKAMSSDTQTKRGSLSPPARPVESSHQRPPRSRNRINKRRPSPTRRSSRIAASNGRGDTTAPPARYNLRERSSGRVRPTTKGTKK